MRYTLIGNNDYLADPITTILTNRGVKDHQKFLHVDETVVHHYILLKNIEKATKCIVRHLNHKSHIVLVVDCDCDGYTSSAIMYNYLKAVDKDANISFIVHTGKEHGFEDDVMNALPQDTNLIIMADAGSNDYEQHKILADRGIDIVILDHHECDIESTNAIVVNNKMCDYPNKMLSGAGVVYKMCKALDDALGKNYADAFLDLVAVGNIGDMMDTRELETRYYILKGLKQIKNPFIKAIIEKQSYSMKSTISMITVAFYVVPLINACVRYGSQEEKTNMFHAFIDSPMFLAYKPRAGKGIKKEDVQEVQQHVTEAMARICSNIKARQDNAKKKGIEIIEQRIQEKGLLNNKILIVNGTGLIEPTMTGLVATELANRYKRPVVILKHYHTDVYGGSARGYEKSELKDFRSLLWETDRFLMVEGHANAFGIQIKKQDVIEVNKILNKKLQDMVFDDMHVVDFIIPAKQINPRIVIDIDKLKTTWGQRVEEPLLAITDLEVGTNSIQLLGKDTKNTIKIQARGIDFMFFNTNEDLYKQLTSSSQVKLTIIGKCSMNEYMGSATPQIMVKDFEFENTDDIDF